MLQAGGVCDTKELLCVCEACRGCCGGMLSVGSCARDSERDYSVRRGRPKEDFEVHDTEKD